MTNYLTKRKSNDLLNFNDWEDFHTRVNRVFEKVFDNEFFSGWQTNIQQASYPKINIINDVKSVTIEATVTGFDKNDIQLKLENNQLIIKSESSFISENYLHKEFSKSSFCRVIPIKEDEFEVDKISAKIENGLMRINIPYKEPKKQKEEKISKIIEIK